MLGNNITAQKSKTIWFPVNILPTDPIQQIFFPDIDELTGKQIVGITANASRETFAFDGDINGVMQPDALQFGITQSEMQLLTVTFVNVDGDEIIQQMPLNVLNLARVKNGVFKEFSQRITPVNIYLNLRRCYIKASATGTALNAYAVFTFYYNEQ